MHTQAQALELIAQNKTIPVTAFTKELWDAVPRDYSDRFDPTFWCKSLSVHVTPSLWVDVSQYQGDTMARLEVVSAHDDFFASDAMRLGAVLTLIHITLRD